MFTTEQDESGVSTENSVNSTVVGLFGAGRASFVPVGGTVFPRLGVDGVLGPGVTLGGSLMYVIVTGEQESSVTAGGMTTKDKEDLPSLSWFLLHPRIGYLADLSPAFSIWPRGGVSYSAVSYELESETFINGMETTQTNTVTISTTTATLELLFLAKPMEGAGITFGAFADLPLSGGTEAESDPEDPADPPPDSADVSLTSFGVVAGVAVIF
jgi:hypothetical protein